MITGKSEENLVKVFLSPIELKGKERVWIPTSILWLSFTHTLWFTGVTVVVRDSIARFRKEGAHHTHLLCRECKRLCSLCNTSCLLVLCVHPPQSRLRFFRLLQSVSLSDDERDGTKSLLPSFPRHLVFSDFASSSDRVTFPFDRKN